MRNVPPDKASTRSASTSEAPKMVSRPRGKLEASLQEQILGNVSKRVRESVVEEKEFLGPLPFTALENRLREDDR